MLVVTTDGIHGWEVQRVCGEVFGVVLRAGNGTAAGPDGEAALTEHRNDAIARMLEHARSKGGNAVVGLRFDTGTVGTGAGELCAYGTAVVAVPVDEGARQTATSLGYGRPSHQDDHEQQQHQQQYDQQQYQRPYDPQGYGRPQYQGQGYGQPQYQGQPNQQPGYQQYPGQGGYPQQ